MQVTEMLAWGFSDKEVATALFISYETVKTHRKNIYAKLGCHNLADLTRWYFEETGELKVIYRPAFRIAIATVFLVLALAMEYFHLDAIRTRSLRAGRETFAERAKRERKEKKTFQFSMI